MPPVGLDVEPGLEPIEENGFLLADFTPESIVLRFFRWNAKQPVESQVDAGRLDHRRIERLELDAPCLDLGADVPVAEQHAARLPVSRRRSARRRSP